MANKNQRKYSVVTYSIHYVSYCKYNLNIYITNTFIIKGFCNVSDVFIYGKYDTEDNFVKAVSIKCSNFRRSTGLYLKNKNSKK